jgi:formylglycine-generating enzyme required for sulfatase activity/predicted methyltransferase
MGADDGDLDEAPAQSVTLPAYSISRNLISNRQFVAYLNTQGTEVSHAVGISLPGVKAIRWDGHAYQVTPGLEAHPVVGVGWDQARGWCAWAGGRLPTEAEWEKAARGADGRRYPWGPDWDPTRALGGQPVASFLAGLQGARMTSGVGAHPSGASPYGCLDMAGNAWEWCSSLYATYPYRMDDGRERLDTAGPRVIRGGSWSDHPTFLRCANRNRLYPNAIAPDSMTAANTGFRVVRSDTPLPTSGASMAAEPHPRYQLLAEGAPPVSQDERYRLGPSPAGVLLGYPATPERKKQYFIPLEHLAMMAQAPSPLYAEMTDMLNVQAGQRVADIGAGSGLGTRLLSRKVGPGGEVWATDISWSALHSMMPPPPTDPVADLYFFQRPFHWEQIHNVRFVLQDQTDCLLPPARLDAALLVNVHYLYYPHAVQGASPAQEPVLAFYRSIRRCLRAGGRMAMAEMTVDQDDGPRGVLSSAELIDEMRQAGFKLAASHPRHKIFIFE